MPPKHVKTIRDLIYWEYAKLISGSAIGDRKNYGFVTYCYQKLKNGKMNPSTILKENKILVKEENSCAYCNSKENLDWEHIIPKSKGGPDIIDNLVLSCRECNLKKSDKDIFEYYGKENRYKIPRLILGKYLKLIFDYHQEAGTLDSAEINLDGELDVLDLGAIFIKKEK